MLPSNRSDRPSVPAIASVVLLVLLCGTVAAVSPAGTVAVLAVALVSVALVLPLWSLPSVALALFALVPVGYLSSVPLAVGRFFTPAVAVLMIWVLRLVLGSPRTGNREALRWLLPLAGVLVFLSALSISPVRSSYWTLVLLLAAAVPVALADRVDIRTAAALLRTWFSVATLLAVAAALEAVLETNPLAGSYTFDQHWSVYRVTTTLGHPLLNGTFFAMTAAMAAFSIGRGTTSRAAGVTCFLACGLAAGLTGSRSGVYALLSGLAVGLAATVLSRRGSAAGKLVGLGATALALVVLPALPTVAARVNSAEGAASSAYRQYVVRLGLDLFSSRPWFGFGPGTSSLAAERAGATLPLENSVLGTLVSTGLLGALVLGLFALLVAAGAVRRRRPEGLAALAAYLVAGSAFPLWETNVASLILVGLVTLATARPAEAVDPPLPATLASSRRRPGTLAVPGAGSRW